MQGVFLPFLGLSLGPLRNTAVCLLEGPRGSR